jgi:hypothetical protein
VAVTVGIFDGGLISMPTHTTKTRRAAVTEWTFRLSLADIDLDDDTQMDVLFETGCGDATFFTEGSGNFAVFHRDAPTPETAVLSAIRDVESTGSDVRVLRVETEDDWLTAAEIADKTGRSRQNVHQLIQGQRGPGNFPPPVSRHNARNPLWSWNVVRSWFVRYAPGSVPASTEHPSTDFLAAVNDRLDLRERQRQAPDAPWWPDMDAVLPLVS